ncbi:MAG: transglutaminase family protein [Chlamydiia bacterium]
MKHLFYTLSLAILVLPISATSKSKKTVTSQLTKIQSVYSTLDPKSLIQHLAFYELYPETEEGKKALATAWDLLLGEHTSEQKALELPPLDVYSIISLVNKSSTDTEITVSKDQLSILERAGKRLENRELDGFKVWTKKEVLALPNEEIDLARALLIYQFEGDLDAKQKINQYEATLDLMALHISAHMKKNASAEEMISEMNAFIFQDMRFRFPPHSIYAKDIDLYTFLPSVLDSRLGVCLGVSTLYLCLAQRIGLSLDIVTPPGHIYLSHNDGHKIINIETTARGINMPSETYLGMNTSQLQKRNRKEVIGLAFFNQASVMSGREDFAGAITLYQIALEYVPGDPLFKMLLGLHYLFNGQIPEGKALLKEISKIRFEGAITQETLPEDFLTGRVDVKGIQTVFLPVDETRDSIIKKQNTLKAHLKTFPKFRAGLFQLATSYLQLGRMQEAYEVLIKYHKLDPTHPIVEYYLAVICMQRYDYVKAWSFYHILENILKEHQHEPKALKELRSTLQRICPTSF